MSEEIRYNREKDYAEAAVRSQHMQLGFLQHSLMISRMHFMLEMTGRNSGGKVLLEAWHQGAELRGPGVNVPEIKSRQIEGGNDYVWEEQVKTKKLPVEPDALPGSPKYLPGCSGIMHAACQRPAEALGRHF